MLRYAWRTLVVGAAGATLACAAFAKPSVAGAGTPELRAAEAAEMQALISWVSAGVSAVGLILLLWTLLETRRTAGAAIAGVKAAEEATAIQREAVERQLRPYVGFTEFVDADVADQLSDNQLRIQMQNFGQTPATEVKFRWSFELRELPLQHEPVQLEDDYQSLGKLSPSDFRNADIRFSLTDENEINLKLGKFVMLIRVEVIYKLPDGNVDVDDVTLYVDRHNHPEIRLYHMSESSWSHFSTQSSPIFIAT